eukprot:3112443-Ditylum_brightwellii.AAC.1
MMERDAFDITLAGLKGHLLDVLHRWYVPPQALHFFSSLGLADDLNVHSLHQYKSRFSSNETQGTCTMPLQPGQ